MVGRVLGVACAAARMLVFSKQQVITFHRIHKLTEVSLIVKETRKIFRKW